VDDELLALAKTSIGDEHGLTPAQSARLHGQTAKELRADARAMRGELGMEPLDEERPRDHGGRFAKSGGIYDKASPPADVMNRLIRSAAGRQQ
jgi:hypothetical protein